MFVPVRVSGTRIEYQQFDEFADRLKDMRGPLGYIGDRLLAGVAAQFDTEGGWGGKPWAELTPLYRAWKTMQGAGLPKLVGLAAKGQKGTRQNPLRPKQYVPSGKMRVELITPSAVSVSPTRMAYLPVSDIAGLHEEGTPKMVARPPVVLPLRELVEWDGAFVDWLDGLADSVRL